jgi:glycosyltransferase involved in cell wall biosynthesis
MPPLVSILIPCFNAEPWIAQAIESALAQTGPQIEVIVVDDGSTDGSLDVIRGFDGRIRWESRPNQGAPSARNRLLELARGEWLQYLDADDYLRPGKIARQLAVAQQYPGCDVVYSPTALEVKQDGQLVTVDLKTPEPHDAWVLLARWELSQTGAALWRKEAVRRVGGWRLDQPCCQEHELYLRMLQAGCRFEHCDGCFSVYRFWNHGSRITNRLRDEVSKQQLLILDRTEAYLAQSKMLTAVRHQAINDRRHAIARTVWQHDHVWALSVADRIRGSDPHYQPRNQPHAPPLYALAFRLIGFHAAQVLADWSRQAFAIFGKRPRLDEA